MKLLKNNILKGTLILSMAGFLSRFIGFIYRIFLSNTLGSHLLGIYQLIFPLYSICFTIYGAGIQTAISQKIASSMSQKSDSKEKQKVILKYGLCLSLSLSLLLSGIVFIFADALSTYFIMEKACAPYLRILCILFPFCGIAACISGYFYGIQSATPPAVAQIVEQLSRVFIVFLLCTVLQPLPEICCSIAVLGMVIGEITGCLYQCFKLKKHFKNAIKKKQETIHTTNQIFFPLFSLAASLTGTKLIVTVLRSVESIFIPAALRKYGYDAQQALEIFGVLSGIAFPFILFPSTITNSFAVMLLPKIATEKAKDNYSRIKNYTTKSLFYSFLIGIVFLFVFFLFGKPLATMVFHDPLAGDFIKTLSFLCPFLYVSTTQTSIINGLGKNQFIFFVTVLSLLVKIYILIALVPIYGIQAYLAGTLICQGMIALLQQWYLKRQMK